MIKITKREPPVELVKLKEDAAEKGLSPDEAYHTLTNPLKRKVTDSLAAEQGYLCAYCMRRLPDNRKLPPDTASIAIEHWFPRNPPDNRDIGQGLDYDNMLAVCSGNRGIRHTRRKSDLTCDAKRRSRLLTVNPLDEHTLETIFYRENGEIGASDSEINDDLTEKLNLNCRSDAVDLPNARKNALEPIQIMLADCTSNVALLSTCRDLLNNFETETDHKTPYVGIIIWWLRDYISAIEKKD